MSDTNDEADRTFEDGWLQATELALVQCLKTLQGDTEAHWRRIKSTVEYRVFRNEGRWR